MHTAAARPFRRGVGAMLRGVRAEPRAATLAIGTGLLNGVSMVLGAAALGWATDHFVLPSFAAGRLLPGAAAVACGLVLAVCALRVTTIVLRGVGTGRIHFAAQAQDRRALTARLSESPDGRDERVPPGRVVSTVLSDVEVAWLPMTWFPFAMGMVFMLVVALASMALTDVFLAAVAALLVPLVLGATALDQRLVPPRARRSQQARAALTQSAHEAFAGHEVLRTLGATGPAADRFAEGTDELRRANVRTASVGVAFDPVVELAPTAAVLAVLAVGAQRYADDALTVGALVNVVYLLLTAAIPLAVIGRFLSVLPAAAVGHERIAALLDVGPPTPSGTARLAAGAGLRLELAGVAHPPGLHAADLDLSPGSVTGLAGATGSGKSTLLTTAAGLSGPVAGRVRLDGQDLAGLAPGELARAVAVVPQAAVLFDASVRDNLRLGRAADDDAVHAALHVAGAEFTEALPEGLDTRLGEGGASLSAGQQQRIALARAVLGRPRLLLLDDVTSALDPAVERVVLDRLAAHVRETGATVLLTAARRASIDLTGAVVHLVDGRVAAVGPDAELRDAHPGYRALVEAYDVAGAEAGA